MNKIAGILAATVVGAAVGSQAFFLLPHCNERWIWRLEREICGSGALDIRALTIARLLFTGLGAGVFVLLWLLYFARRGDRGYVPPDGAPSRIRRRYFLLSQAGAALVVPWVLVALAAPLLAAHRLDVTGPILWGLSINGMLAAILAARSPSVPWARRMTVCYLVLAVLALPMAYEAYFPRAYNPLGNRCGYDLQSSPVDSWCDLLW